jgi:hypothetical protein
MVEAWLGHVTGYPLSILQYIIFSLLWRRWRVSPPKEQVGLLGGSCHISVRVGLFYSFNTSTLFTPHWWNIVYHWCIQGWSRQLCCSQGKNLLAHSCTWDCFLSNLSSFFCTILNLCRVIPFIHYTNSTCSRLSQWVYVSLKVTWNAFKSRNFWYFL